MHFQSQLHWKKFYTSFQRRRMVRSFCRELGVSEAVAEILKDRGVTSTQEAKNFLNPSSEICHDPFLMCNMEKAVCRIVRAIKKREKILIYGDADADGMSATALLFLYLKKIGGRVQYVIPYRLTEGRGINTLTIQRALRSSPHVMVTVDQGSSAIEEVKEVVNAGIDLIVTDHHLVSEERPDVFALENPKQSEMLLPLQRIMRNRGCF